jgi:hypothetical protein
MPELVAVTYKRWEEAELAAEIRDIMASIDAPPIDDQVMYEFQKTLHRSRMFGMDGRGRIILTCRCILESRGNEGAFAEPFVSAVDDICGKKEFVDCGLGLIEAFDQIPLLKIVETMRGLDLFKESSIRLYLPMIIKNKVGKILFPSQPEPPKPPSKLERIAADKHATAAAKRKIVEKKIEVGRKLAALREVTPNNKRFGRAVRDKFDLHNSLEVAEMMRVARRYAHRPEIYRATGWRVLEQLASTKTSDEMRDQFEARILAGERVNGSEIIRARPSVNWVARNGPADRNAS